mmetsp:Transcript_16246/g.44071  ORF Transcript_16246/g.44071 Transcript_16246/m.44071 type:complete len:170 (-) Transcript_16246:29-538(-)
MIHNRARLTPDQVAEIFESKKMRNTVNFSTTRHSAHALSRKFGVTEKAIRDIWRGRTWSHTTLQKRLRQPKISELDFCSLDCDDSTSDYQHLASHRPISFQFPNLSETKFSSLTSKVTQSGFALCSSSERDDCSPIERSMKDSIDLLLDAWDQGRNVLTPFCDPFDIFV